ncbi:DUF2268 domain-containing putative Zn-dependent protease [Chondrinema litorale]|uniref:gliding motility protein GldB-related protein n=1 Tax=Chondrinema litorale TaxID=2994555 RepID=UPI0025439556|nr:DUF2268 domain-containing putative Zn-dependent protease [Chondrinema litorale]UZR97417.1 DUF2268 domain-containing putative Zn-dependent protease [Chondrinema litorale]
MIQPRKAINYICTFFLIIFLQACSSILIKQDVSDLPANSQIITSDIDNFYNAFDLALEDTTKAEEIFKEYYFSVGTKGLKEFYKSKIHSTEKFSDFVIHYRDFYQSIRENVSDIHDLENQIFDHFKVFENLYPTAVFPDVYFVIGRFSSNGTISKNGLLIGTEILSHTDDLYTENWNKEILRISMERSHIPVTVAHELVHFNQSKMKKGNTLLWKSIREGSAEFIAEFISGETDGDYAAFEGRELDIWKDFKEDMDKSIWSPWQQASEKHPKNAGYWAGYMICKAYYDQIGDKEKSIYDILHIEDYQDFYYKSKVEKYLEDL